MSDNQEKDLKNMTEENVPEEKVTEENVSEDTETQEYSLNDDRRVKVLSPGALVMKRFFRNRIAVAGLIILIAMFAFCFIGGVISPYGQNEIFYRTDEQLQEYVAATENSEYRYLVLSDEFGSVVKAMTGSAINTGDESFDYDGATYTLVEEGEGFYSVYLNDTVIGAAYLAVISAEDTSITFTDEFQYDAQMAYAAGGGSFTCDGVDYEVDDEGIIYTGGEEYAVISPFIVASATSGRVITAEFKAAVSEALEAELDSFEYTDEDGETAEYIFDYDPSTGIYSVKKYTATRVYDTYSFPSKKHWLGTDKYGMDMLTRIMYGGRISLLIGFIVIFIEIILGIIFGGISGYFGGWVDNLIMRIVDIFYCIPSKPLIIILGAAMDALKVSPLMRIIYLMLILGFLGWPSIARMVRGQILSLREQEFMTATEACGVRVSRRIFRHLVPNVMPQLIVIATMSIGSTILTEATLSFLGLGVKFPFASWGNIINDVSNSYVLTSYWFIWIPAGICLLLTVLAFNFVGDGLRDAFDPKMKR